MNGFQYWLISVPCMFVCLSVCVYVFVWNMRQRRSVGAEDRRKKCGGEERFEEERKLFLRLRNEVAEKMRSASFLNARVNVLLYPIRSNFEDIDYMLSGPKLEDMMWAKFRLEIDMGFGKAPVVSEMFEVGPEKYQSTYDGYADFLGAVNGRLEDVLRDICVLEPICRAVRDDKLRIEEVERTFGNI